MEPIARLVDVEQREDKTRLLGDMTNSAGRLDILGGGCEVFSMLIRRQAHRAEWFCAELVHQVCEKAHFGQME